MGFIDLKKEPRHFRRIENALARRGLHISVNDDWEVHGPHPEMNYQVYVGAVFKKPDPDAECVCPTKNSKMILAHCRAHRQYFAAAVYPKAVYAIEDTDRWTEVTPDDRIMVAE